MLYFICDVMKKIKLLLIIFLIISLIPISINFFVIYKTKNDIYNIKDINKNYDYALVLGCSALKDGSPSKMLRDRVDTAISLYENKMVKKILITGDHEKDYSEVTAMYNYLINSKILEEDIIVDNKGYSTSESLLNYQKNYRNKSMIIVTQRYHLFRSLYIAQKLELDAIGVHAILINYNGQIFREIREVLARNKDFILSNFI